MKVLITQSQASREMNRHQRLPDVVETQQEISDTGGDSFNQEHSFLNRLSTPPVCTHSNYCNVKFLVEKCNPETCQTNKFYKRWGTEYFGIKNAKHR